jgi:hypothetical protein
MLLGDPGEADVPRVVGVDPCALLDEEPALVREVGVAHAVL